MPGRLDRVLTLISGSLAACGGVAQPEPPAAREATCVLASADATNADDRRAMPAAGHAPIVIAVDRPIDLTRAPRPASRADQIVFAQVYETLVRVDCSGAVVPGLAESWRPAAGGAGWSFTLRPDAQFHDGDPVTAKDVAESLVATTATAGRRERAPRHDAAPGIAGVTVLGEDVLRVELVDAAGGSGGDGVAAFATPELAIGKSAADEPPLGSGPYEIVDTTPPGTARATVALRPARPARAVEAAEQPAAPAGAALLPLAFRVTPDGDPRNALDAGVDVLVTADPDAIDYALARGSYITAPLPWDAAYVLFVPLGSEDAGTPIRAPAGALDALARDAVPAVARASSLDTVWTCPASRAPAARPRRRPRVAFISSDRTAAGLAERLVALARTNRAGWIGDAVPAARAATLTAAPLSDAELAASLRAGRDAAYVIRVDLDAPTPCPAPPGRVSLRAVPLVDTRKTAILRAGLEGVTADAAGTLYFAGAWRRPEMEPRR